MLACTRTPSTATTSDARRALFCRQPFFRDLQGLLPSSSSSSSYDDAEDDRAFVNAPAAPATPPSFRGSACAPCSNFDGTPSPPRFRQGCYLPASTPLDVTFHRPSAFLAETLNKRSCAALDESPWTKRRRLCG